MQALNAGCGWQALNVSTAFVIRSVLATSTAIGDRAQRSPSEPWENWRTGCPVHSVSCSTLAAAYC